MSSSKLARYVHTVRYLRPVQLAARVALKLHRPSSDRRPAPALRRPDGPYARTIEPAASLLGADLFRFLGIERRCAAASDWAPGGASRLWTYNLHYFEDLNARGADDRRPWHRALLERWVLENPPGSGAGWEPYPLSRRIANWVKWAARGNELPAVCSESLAVQTRWLLGRLEYHLLGNHLLANAKALLHAGAFFEGPEAAAWSTRGHRILRKQLPEQILPDGAHFELSTMYHASVLEDLLDLINVSRFYGLETPADWRASIARMFDWLANMTHPDGELSFFNDATFEIAPRFAELETYAARLGIPAPSRDGKALVALDSGYVRASAGPAYLICDCAPIGPDYLPGHAHADTLSFELSLSGQRVLVNSGISEYGEGAERVRQRGTAAHNSVVVDGCDSSEVWSGFRVARRARSRLHAAGVQGDAIVIEASHDGYTRLPGRNEHRRRWTLARDGLQVEDRVTGRFASAEAHFHFHPGVQARATSSSAIELIGPAGLRGSLEFEGARSVALASGSWHPGFGLAVQNQRAAIRFEAGRLLTTLRWEDPRQDDVATVPR